MNRGTDRDLIPVAAVRRNAGDRSRIDRELELSLPCTAKRKLLNLTFATARRDPSGHTQSNESRGEKQQSSLGPPGTAEEPRAIARRTNEYRVLSTRYYVLHFAGSRGVGGLRGLVVPFSVRQRCWTDRALSRAARAAQLAWRQRLTIPSPSPRRSKCPASLPDSVRCGPRKSRGWKGLASAEKRLRLPISRSVATGVPFSAAIRHSQERLALGRAGRPCASHPSSVSPPHDSRVCGRISGSSP